MNKQKNYIDKYNRPETVAVVSLYPKKGEVYSAGASGVASYTKNVVRDLKQPVVVLADIWGKSIIYEEDQSLVLRVWQRNRKRMWLQLLLVLKQLTQVSGLLIHFDFSMYGGMLNSGLIIPFLGISRLMGFKPVVVSHHVIKDVRRLSGQVGLGEGLKKVIKTFVYNLTFRLFYWLLGLVAERIVVLEEPLKERLAEVIPERKLAVIPHAVDEHIKVPAKKAARHRLGYGQDEQVVLFFGYVNWFKGADLFAQAFDKTTTLGQKPARFVMAGGESPTLKEKAFYQKYYEEVVGTVRGSKRIELTGYVPQEKIGDYFAACDVVVFPYREFMCASGVMAQAFAYKKPIIVSKTLARVFSTGEMQQILRSVNLRLADVTFSLDAVTMLEVTERVLENGLKTKLKRMARRLREERSFAKTSYLYKQVLIDASSTRQAPAREGVWAYAVDE